MSFRKTLLAATMLALPLAAQAQPVTGLYVAGAVGANWQSDVSANAFMPEVQGGNFGMNATTSVGWVALASAGWGFGNGLRLEGEVNYRSNDAAAQAVKADPRIE